MKESIKNILYTIALFNAKIYWFIFKPITRGARIIIIYEDSVLLVKHRTRNNYNLPGGGIHKNEEPLSGAIREVREETGIIIPAKAYLLGEYKNSTEGKKDTVFVFVSEIETKITPQITFELSDAKWFPLELLPENISQATLQRIKEYQEGFQEINTPWLA